MNSKPDYLELNRLYRPRNGLIKLCLKKRGEYKDSRLLVRDLRFVSNVKK